jgi:23S rRNA pseudouridine2604 synthase
VVTEEFLQHMSEGVYLSELDVTTRPCKVWKSKYNEFHIILTQGLNRQIRRMCQEEGYYVHDLRRIRIMNLTLDGIEEGKYRKITPQEEQKLKQDIGL